MSDTNAEREQLLDVLEGLTRHATRSRADGRCGSGTAAAIAAALRVLANHGRFLIEFDDGDRSVAGRFVPTKNCGRCGGSGRVAADEAKGSE